MTPRKPGAQRGAPPKGDLRTWPERYLLSWARTFERANRLSKYAAFKAGISILEGRIVEIDDEADRGEDGWAHVSYDLHRTGQPSRTFKGRYETFRRLDNKTRSDAEELWLDVISMANGLALSAEATCVDCLIDSIRIMTALVGESAYAERVLVPLVLGRFSSN